MNAQDRERYRAMLEDPRGWPYWPILPMKRSLDYSPNLGFVTADYPSIILKKGPTMKGILLQLACEAGMPVLGGNDGEVTILEQDSEARKLYENNIVKRYDDIDGMLDDGWVID